MRKRFDGRVVLITGAAGGLGRVSAVRFAREGAHLILTDSNDAGLEHAAAQVREAGATCAVHGLDLASEVDIRAFGARICSQQPRLDVLFNNAGSPTARSTGRSRA